MTNAPSNAATPSAAPEFRKDRYRVSSLLVKKTGMTDEEFFTYWREVHGPLFAGLEITKKNLIKYEQHHYNNAFEKGVQANGYSVPEFQGIAVFEAESFEKILEIFDSEEYKRTVYLDEDKFIERGKCVFCPGFLVPYIDRSQ